MRYFITRKVAGEVGSIVVVAEIVRDMEPSGDLGPGPNHYNRPMQMVEDIDGPGLVVLSEDEIRSTEASRLALAAWKAGDDSVFESYQPQELLQEAYEGALEDLRDMATWDWGRAHNQAAQILADYTDAEDLLRRYHAMSEEPKTPPSPDGVVSWLRSQTG